MMLKVSFDAWLAILVKEKKKACFHTFQIYNPLQFWTHVGKYYNMSLPSSFYEWVPVSNGTATDQLLG